MVTSPIFIAPLSLISLLANDIDIKVLFILKP